MLLRSSMVATSLLVTLLMLEGIARLIPLWPDQISDFDPELGFAHIPGAEGWWVNVAAPFEFRTRVKINSHGLNDREFPLDKPSGVSRILVLGDSIVDGLEVPQEHTFPKQLERLLRESGPHPIEVINGGHYGYGTDQELLFFRQRGQQFQPDIVVLAFTPGNDIDDNLAHASLGPKPYFELSADGQLQLYNFPVEPPDSPDLARASFLERAKQSLYTHSKLYRFTGYHIKRQLPFLESLLVSGGLMDTTEEVGPALLTEDASIPGPYQAFTSDDYEYGWQLTQALILELKKEVEASDAELVVVILPDPLQFAAGAGTPGWNVTKWNDRLGRLCISAELDCLDLYPIFQSLMAQERSEALFYPRDGHPTSKGHYHIAEALYRHFSTRISAK